MSDAKTPVRKKIAVPVEGGRLAAHFGHCGAFELFETDAAACTIVRSEVVDAPPHEPGRLPAWLAALGVEVVIAGGMGHRAQDLFTASGIDVVVGAPSNAPRDVVQSYLEGKLEAGRNICDH